MSRFQPVGKAAGECEQQRVVGATAAGLCRTSLLAGPVKDEPAGSVEQSQ